MARVVFLARGHTWTTDAPVGTSILGASKVAHAPEGDACGGVCGCSTCHVYVREGQGLLSEREEDEEDILDKAFDVRATSRLGCQAKIEQEGTIVVEITRESLDAFDNEHPGGVAGALAHGSTDDGGKPNAS